MVLVLPPLICTFPLSPLGGRFSHSNLPSYNTQKDGLTTLRHTAISTSAPIKRANNKVRTSSEACPPTPYLPMRYVINFSKVASKSSASYETYACATTHAYCVEAYSRSRRAFKSLYRHRTLPPGCFYCNWHFEGTST